MQRWSEKTEEESKIDKKETWRDRKTERQEVEEEGWRERLKKAGKERVRERE